jgi:nucleotide-binding universal stress UspA family protein
MALRHIVVVLDDSAQSEARLTTAIALARQHEAFLTGLCPLDTLRPVAVAARTAGKPGTVNNLADIIDRVEADFVDRLNRGGLRGGWKSVPDTASEAFVRHTRQTDLIVLGQVNPEHPPPAGRHMLEDVLLNAGRPILAIPYAGRFETLGARILVGWNGSREAARALHDALPFLAKAASVTVLDAFPAIGDAPDDASISGIAHYLGHHGIEAKITRLPLDGVSPADALLSYTMDIDADLLVAGGYGHSRLRELVFGGVTRGLLQHLTVPVLMSH